MRKVAKKQGVLGAVSVPVSIGGSVERHLRMGEAAKVIGVSRSTLYRLLPEIRHIRVPAGGLTRYIVLIPSSALAQFLSRFERNPETPSDRN